jgi:recombinational DNA repair ATPase RecF
VPDLDALVESSIKIAERELATLDEKLNLTNDLENQVKIHQGALDVLLTRRHIVEERDAAYQAANPALQVERAHEQQTALSQALQALRESLHQRVKPLGVMFGQTAISSAETSARKQLESLQILLGGKLMLQEKHDTYMVNLKERQASLSGLYKQLAKYSNSLGSWIVPLNPFSGQLVALRARCHDELQEANEEVIQKELAGLESQEGASKAKIALCRQDIETAQEHIASLLVQRKRPVTKNFALADLVAIWPLLSEYAVADQQRLEEERDALEKEMSSLEEQEMELSKRLNAPETPLDLEQMRARKEEQERSYLVKKHGNRLIEAIDQRLLRKMQPRIEHYMQQILPLLTSGRYHDVHLTTENEEGTASGGPFQIEVWDSAAGEYVSKSALSGGAADQLSLALRLAFAIAALPRELNVAPGFVLLDEPLSSFDLGRAQALANVVTGDVLCQHFEQIILISHSSAFDPALFPYHLYLDSGMIVESNLPIVLEPSVSETETLLDVDAHLQTVAQQDEPQEAPVTDDVEEDEEDLLTVHVPAITSFVRKGTK